MPIASYIVATAGHVDHGKSALVKALTGIDPDRLPEEKSRGITIDLGFAHADLPGPAVNGQPTTIHLGIVDVPGHEDFVKNMVAGVVSIDLALFVVAADDGWMPQTEEHLQILAYLGVTRAVVALSKIDLCPSENITRAQIRERFAGTPFAAAPIIATSIIQNRGVEELKAAIADALAKTPPQHDYGKPRLPVDRAFVLRGVGTVVTGTLIGGILQRGQNVIVQPSRATARIRTLQTHNREVESAGPGSRVALNLPDLQVASRTAGNNPDSIARGDVITLAEFGSPGNTLDVVLERSRRAGDFSRNSAAARPMKDGLRVHVHHGSADVPARVYLLDKPDLLPAQRAFAQLRLESAIFAFAGDRFILRDWPEQMTLAGGVVLDPQATRECFRSDTRRRQFESLERAINDPTAMIVAILARDRAIHRTALLARTHFSQADVAAAIARLTADGRIVAAGEVISDLQWWQELRRHAIGLIDAEHKAHSDRIGLALSDLRKEIESRVPAGVNVFDALVDDLKRDGFVRNGAAIRRANHRPALPAHLQSAGARIRDALAAKALDPPARKELVLDSVSFQALKFLITTGQAIEISDDLVLSADAFQKAADAVRQYLRQNGPATVSKLRQALSTSRRIMVPFLERLDRDGVTLRQNDKRALRSP